MVLIYIDQVNLAIFAHVTIFADLGICWDVTHCLMQKENLRNDSMRCPLKHPITPFLLPLQFCEVVIHKNCLVSTE